MKLYFMRHAQTPGNARHVWVGRQDEDLSEAGQADLERVANELGDFTLNYIYTSPLKRALRTAEAVAERQKGLPDLRVRAALQERGFGCYEGELKTPENRARFNAEPTVETLESMQKRLGDVLNEIDALLGVMLLVSHSAVYRCLVESMGYTATPAKKQLANAEWVELKKV